MAAYRQLTAIQGNRRTVVVAWIQRQSAETMSDDALWDYLRESHRLISLKLTRRLRKELGLLPA